LSKLDSNIEKWYKKMMQFYIPEVLGVIQVEDETDKIAEKEFEKFEQKISKIEDSNNK